MRPATSSTQSTHTACRVPQVFETPEVVRVYVGSFWAAPLKNSENSALFAKVAVGAAPSNASLVGSPLAAEGPTGRPGCGTVGVVTVGRRVGFDWWT